MKLRVAIPLIAAICLGSPAIASSPDEQMVNGRGARDRSAGNSGGGERKDGGSTTPRSNGGGERSGNERRRDDGERTAVRVERRDNDDNQRAVARTERRDGDDNQRTAVRVAPDHDRDNNRADNRENNRADDQRYAVPRAPNRYNPPIIVRRESRPNININIGSSYRPRYYAPYYYDRWARSYYSWSPIGYAPWSLIFGSIGFSNYGFYGAYGSPYPYYSPYAYSPYAYGGPWQPSGYDIGAVRLRIRPRDAQVFVDGYYAGLVDDFDGTFQSLRLEQGGHKIEIHMPGYEDLELDVHVQPGRTITLQEDLRPRP